MSAPGGGRIVEFPSGDALLRGYLFEHEPNVRRPAVAMTHGFSATITGMTADRYAKVIHAAGLTVLLFDHRSFGLSGGEPRQRLNDWTQMAGYRDALDYLSTLPTVDAARLGVWGDSMSGAVALAVTAFDERVRAVVVQVPACGGESAPADPDGGAFRRFRDIYRSGLPPDVEIQTFGPKAVVSADQLTSPSFLRPITAFRWFIDYGGRPGTGWQNQGTYEEPILPVPFHAALCTPHMTAASLWIVARDDEMSGAVPAIAREAFVVAPEPKEWLDVDGGHFGLLYHPSELFDEVSAVQAEFLVRRL
jgi:pimeloyl-ACP methyl ester carboxylesterase